MSVQWQPKMKSVISELLETMFFLSVDFEPADSPATYGVESTICLARGLHKMSIGLLMVESFARAAAANFLGIDEDEVTAGDLEDVAREMANMIGGNYMTLLDEADWALGIPSARRLENGGETPVDGLPVSYLGEHVGVVTLSVE